MELTQLELIVNDSCWIPPGIHLSRIKAFLPALSSACVIHCNELRPAPLVLGDIGDLMLVRHTAMTRYYCRIMCNYGNMSAPSAVEWL